MAEGDKLNDVLEGCTIVKADVEEFYGILATFHLDNGKRLQITPRLEWGEAYFNLELKDA